MYQIILKSFSCNNYTPKTGETKWGRYNYLKSKVDEHVKGSSDRFIQSETQSD